MDVQDCPACWKNGVFHLVSESTDLFRCYGCPSSGHLFGLHKDYPRRFFHITPLLRKPETSSVK